METIKNKLNECLAQEEAVIEISKISGSLVKNACTRMKPGKTDVTEGFTSDVFLHGPDILFDLLASIFQAFLVHGSVTPQILSCAFLPLFKGDSKTQRSLITVGQLQVHHRF